MAGAPLVFRLEYGPCGTWYLIGMQVMHKRNITGNGLGCFMSVCVYGSVCVCV